MNNIRERKEAARLGYELADASWREVQDIEVAAIAHDLVDRDDASADKEILLATRQTCQRGDRVHLSATHAHKERIMHRVSPTEQLDPGTFGVRDRLRGELSIRD